MKNTINISNNANLILNTYRCLFFKLLLRVFSVVQQLRSERGNGKVLESALQHSKFCWFLRFFTCVSWGISSAQILLIVQTTAIRHSIFYFSSFSMFIQSRISKPVVICSFLFFSPLYLFHPTLFYSSFYSLFCFLPLFIHFIFWSPLWFSFQICYPFFSLFLLLCSVCFSLMLCSYSICSLSISLHPFRYLYLILLCYLFCSCFCFLYTSSFW